MARRPRSRPHNPQRSGCDTGTIACLRRHRPRAPCGRSGTSPVVRYEV